MPYLFLHLFIYSLFIFIFIYLFTFSLLKTTGLHYCETQLMLVFIKIKHVSEAQLMCTFI